MQTWFECKVNIQNARKRQRAKGNETSCWMLSPLLMLKHELSKCGNCQRRIYRYRHQKSRIVETFPFEKGEWWFRATINLATIDEEAGKEKTSHNYLVMADDIQEGPQLMRLRL